MGRFQLVISTVLFLLWGASARADSPFGQAETYFQKRLYQQALDAFEKAPSDLPTDPAFKVFYRTQETRALLFRYAESAQALYARPVSSEPLPAARHLLLRTEVARRYLRQYFSRLPQDAMEGSTDVTLWTLDQWQKRIAQDYFALLPLRDALAAEPLAEETFFLQTQETDTESIPSLWDFAVARWTEYLLQESGDNERPDPLDWVDKGFIPRLTPETPAGLLAASLWEDASRRGGTGRATAKELWTLKRVYPPWLTPSENRRETLLKLAASLKTLFQSFQSPRAKAAAAEDSALVLHALGEFEKALQICELALAEQKSAECSRLKTEIQAGRLELEAFPSAPLETHRVKVRARNLAKVYVRLYPTSVAELEQQNGRENNADWTPLRLLTPKAAAYFQTRKPAHVSELTPVPTQPYGWSEFDADLPPALAPGLYTVLVSDDKTAGASLLRGTILHVTDLFLFADRPVDRKRGINQLALRVLDGSTGNPVAGALTKVRQSSKGAPASARTGAQGQALLPLPAGSADPLVEKDKSLALLPGPLWISQVADSTRLEIHIDTDRPFYRPGQKVQARITLLRQDDKGVSRPSVSEVDFWVLDANGKSYAKRKVKVGTWGSAVVEFHLPAQGLLGTHTLTATARETGSNRIGNGNASVRVEEYAPADFEVVLDAPTQPWRLGKNTQVTGSASFLFGGPVAQSLVRYRIFRESFLPLQWRFWRGSVVSDPRRQVAGGEARTDERGAFSFSFLPEGGKDGMPGRFTVEVGVVGPSGRMVSESHTYLVGPQAFALELTGAQGYFLESDIPRVALRAISLEGQPVDTQGTFRVDKLGAFDTKEKYFQAQDLPARLASLPVARKVHSGSFQTRAGDAELVLPSLGGGVYRITATTQDAGGAAITQTYETLVMGPGLVLPAAAFSRGTAAPGEQASCLLGSSDIQGKMVIEIWRGEDRLASRVEDGGLREVRVPIDDSHRGGITVRWYGVYQHRLRSGETQISVPWNDRKLALTLQAPAQAAPGEKAQWKLQLRDAKGKPVDAEALVRVTDRALDTYATQPAPWVETIYGASAFVPATNISYAALPFAWLQDRESVATENVPHRTLPLPHLRFAQGGALYGGGGLRMMVAAKSALAETEAAPASPSTVLPRRNFEQTAFFAGQLPVQKGEAQVRFRFPDSNTAWNVQAYALDAEYRWAAVQTRVVTQRDFFVRAHTPRFVREGDKAQIQAVVTNNTSGSVSAKAHLRVSFGAQSLTLPAQAFSLPPGRTQTVHWSFDVPPGTGQARAVVSAVAGKLQDAEDRTILWLPGKLRQVHSQVACIEPKKTTELSVDKIPQSAQVESATLQIDPQLATAIFRSLPNLVENPRTDVASVVDRAVPLAVANQIFRSIPQLARALEKHKGPRKTWNAADTRRLVEVLETPWVRESQDSASGFDFSDDKAVARLTRDTWDKLAALQKPSGAFPWFAGGPDDDWLTLYVLGRLAEARTQGVEVPPGFASKAHGFLKNRLPLWLKADSGSLTFALFAAHVLTTLYEPSVWKEQVGDLLNFAEKQSDQLTAVGKAYFADTAFRRGENERGKTFLARAMDGMRESPWGAYWTPEKQSWVWYSDTLDKHALLLRLLLDWSPADERIASLAKWMLFSRKASTWESSRNASSAVLALLQYQKSQKTLFENETFTWKWNGKKSSLALRGDASLDAPLTWNIQGGDRATRKATVEKSGGNLAFASLSAVFYSADGLTASSGPVSLQTRFFTRVADAKSTRLVPLPPEASVKKGAEIEAQFTLQASVPLEYLQLKVPRAAGFEPVARLSGWEGETVAYYREIRDSQDSFFVPLLATGETVVRARYFATTPGTYRFGPMSVQSLYSPDLTASAQAALLKVVP